MIKRHSTLFFFCILFSYSTHGQQAIGQWAEKLSYRKINKVTSDGDMAFAASAEGLFSYNLSSGILGRLSKVNGLSDVGVRSLDYDATQDILVVGYANGNLDVVQGSQITNISDIKRSTIIGDLGINDILIIEDEAWLSCGFGIVVLNLNEFEVSDTYIIGDLGTNLAVNNVLVEVDKVYAATENGLRVANRNSNLADFSNWSTVTAGLPSPNDEYGQILRFQNRLLTFNTGDNDSVFEYDGAQWTAVAGSGGQEAQRISVLDEEVLFVFAHHFNLRDSDLNTITDTWSYSFDSFLDLNSGQLIDESNVLIADNSAGLVLVTGGEAESILPDGPYTDLAWQADASNGELWIAHGELQSNFDNVYSNNGFSGFDGFNWRLKAEVPGLEDVRDFVDVRNDPLDLNKVYLASFLGGVISYDKATDVIEVFDTLNSPIEDSQINPGRIQVGSLAFDFNGNLWATNSYTSNGWKILKRDGDWEEMHCPTALAANPLFGEMVITELGQTWTVMPRGNGLVVMQHSNEIISTSNHPCKKLSTEIGEGGLPTNTTLSIAEDLDGEIWLGTSEGPVVNYSPQSIFSNNPVDFQPILVERDGNVERLLGSESITAIEVDGANRKWLGTLNGGVFLLSEDGTEEIHHFTEENSPLFSNAIRDIAIDQATGVVHFLTNSGTISYMSDATLGKEENECFDVYPNPVRPEYYGPVTIDGLMAESEVKITDIAGNIVFQTVANGGRAVWQGTDFSGDRVSTGVYFALVSNRDGESSCISKILFIN